MVKKKAKEDNKLVWIIVGLVALFLLYRYGTEHGWINFSVIGLPQGNYILASANFPNPSTFGQPQIDSHLDNPDYEVKLEVEPFRICAGDYATGRITSNMRNAGCRIFVSVDNGPWHVLADVFLGETGVYEESQRVMESGTARFIAICCDPNFQCSLSNQVSLVSEICIGYPPIPPLPIYELGDSVGGGSGVGSITGQEGSSVYFNLDDVAVGGDCYLGARVYTNWDYADYQECYAIGGQGQGVDIYFADSGGVVWSASDQHPNTRMVDLCPLYWDGATPWKLSLFPQYSLPDCRIDFQYNVDIYVCHCE